MTKKNFKIQVRVEDNGMYKVGVLNEKYKYEWTKEYTRLSRALKKAIEGKLDTKPDVIKESGFVDDSYFYNPQTKSYHKIN